MKIGLIAGSFDVLHPGYIKMFEQMEDECDQIWVLLQTDPTVERPEKMKPILSVKDRTEMLIALRHVNHIIPYTLESELYYKLKQFAGDESTEYVRYLGDDYVGKSFTGDDLDLPIRYLNRDHGWSTTKYKKLIADEVQRSSNI
jgi:glycerol-3-phosphate cytidylyltransferase